MISSRVFASALRAQAPALQAVKARPAARIFQQSRGFKNTTKLREPIPRLRTLKKIPPELIPIGVVLAVAITFAAYSLIRKLFTDGTLRLNRSRGHNQAASKPSH
ncbi:hypothetical protein E4T44_10522 [Aureobasidium sp. EXF-8845]|nr:hypothetical protein E4T44_10522 [Aureobasidium sp. EXF-8845]KAI4841906.1 hypothetical protein E4T45_09299 [Aureobasidium sp. EXF-8846]